MCPVFSKVAGNYHFERGSTTPNKALRDELDTERRARRALVDTLGDTDPEVADFGDVSLTGAPIGRMFNSQKVERNTLVSHVLGEDGPSTKEGINEHIESHGTLLEQLETGKVTVTHGGLTDAVRQRLLPIHEMWIGVREGREEKVPSANVRRGARLFGRFIKKASGEASVGVDATYNTYSMESSTAREILAGAGNMTTSGETVTVKRAMKAVQSMTKRQDCGCDTAEECEHAVIVWNNDGGHTLVANKDEFNALMGTSRPPSTTTSAARPVIPMTRVTPPRLLTMTHPRSRTISTMRSP